ncbi:SpoIIE family protein phosphatase [Streptomyces chiangmaiensis]|uniref:SpoIIE family protein phosphatase n=1 Tax=Streptomyces chiangmaiensis TaxID=766497 RepID=A0ABU7FMC1_9ACTN|nr:SpoIIE family protein phosphatase [Streptomyces chiangmaiensis]MED7824963.1 SpoIIE family protein phosphatase [Streptomyces chiangmaiensis]
MSDLDTGSGAGSAYCDAGAALAVVGPSGTVTRWTDAARQLLGYRPQEVLGRSAGSLLASPGESRDGFDQEWSGRTVLRRRDGRTVDVSLRVSALSGEDGTVEWLVSLTGAPGSARAVSVAENCPFPMAVWDSELRMAWLNEALADAYGSPREARLGRVLEESPLYADTSEVKATLREVLDSGVPVIGRELDQRDRRWRRTYALSVFPVENARAGESGVCSLNVDVTSSRRARERITLLSRAGTRIGTTLDVRQTAQDLADVVVPVLADYATVDLLDSAELGGRPLTQLGAAGDGRIPAFHRGGMASIHEGMPESLWSPGDPVFVPPNSPFMEVLASGRSYLEPELDASPGTWLAQDPRRRERVVTLGMHSLLILPIHARGEILGVTVLVRTENLVPFDENDRLVAEELVSRAALSLDNARRYAREHTAALALQRDLLPRHPSGGSAVDAVWRYLPSDKRGGVGGDWFDVIQLSGARVALVVGDVVGHGINAAAAMGRIRTATMTLAALDLPPAEVLANLDDLLARLAAESVEATAMPPAIMGATCLYVVYDPISRRCTAARAGHPPPALVDPSGAVTLLDVPPGAPLGVGTRTFEAVEYELSEESTLVLYTDGLVETHDHDIDFGLDRLCRALGQRPGAPLEELCSSAVAIIPAGEQSDDVAVLLARSHSLDPDQVMEWELAADAAAVGGVRAAAVRTLTDWRLERLVPAAEQIIGELLANAVLHAAGPVRLRLIRYQVLVCEVFDRSLHIVRAGNAGPTDEGGRGVAIVAALASRFGSRWTSNGKCVWAELPLPPGGGDGGETG